MPTADLQHWEAFASTFSRQRTPLGCGASVSVIREILFLSLFGPFIIAWGILRKHTPTAAKIQYL